MSEPGPRHETDKSLRTIFNEAVELEDAQQRADYLARVCGPDAALRQKLVELIAAHAEAGGFLVTEHDAGARLPAAGGALGVPPTSGPAAQPPEGRTPSLPGVWPCLSTTSARCSMNKGS